MRPYIQNLLEQSRPILLGKERELKLAICCLLCDGHLLLEDVPGMGKTTLVYLLAKTIGIDLSRIQFTNDLLPSDILGINVFEKSSDEFRFIKGPIFGHLILADELNRASPKTQSALLQAMEERVVSIDGKNYPLNPPFLVIATQNPSYQLGTFPLPESQLDRFHMSLSLGFPSREDERKILQLHDIRQTIDSLGTGPGKEVFLAEQKRIHTVQVSDKILDYVLNLLEVGRRELENGTALSPRSGQDALMAAKAWAYIHEKEFVTANDVQEVLESVWGHRVGGSRGRQWGADHVKELIQKIKID